MDTYDINKTSIINTISTLLESLKSITDEIEPDTDDLTLIIKKYRGSEHFHIADRQGKDHYLRKSETDLISKYAQKRYRTGIRKAAEKEMVQLKRCLDILTSHSKGISDINEVYAALPDAMKPYVTPHPLSDEEYARQWQEGNTVVKRKNIHREDDYHKYKTIRGDYVGSKSEALIADRLYANGIPYHYEVAFIPEAEPDYTMPVYDMYGRIVGYDAPAYDPFARDTLHPDFYVLNKRTRKAYYWEHLGRLDDSRYCTDNLNRFVRVLDAGYTIGEEILVTHEDRQNPLRLERVDGIIEKFLK
jgi:hypothetical protein